MTLTHDEARTFVEKLSYKPGAEFEYLPYDTFGGVAIRMPAKEVGNPECETVVTMRLGWSLEGIDERGFLAQVETLIVRNCELHEMHEWLRYDGLRLTEPHPEVHGLSSERLHPLRRRPAQPSPLLRGWL